MRRLIRLILTIGAVGLVALMPNIAQAASEDTTFNFFGVEYQASTYSGSFAGVGTTSDGQLVVFNTTINHTALTSGGSAEINSGTFTAQIGPHTLAGTYTNGDVSFVSISPLFGVFCKEIFAVTGVTLGPASAVPGTTSIVDGRASGTLTHIGLFGGGGSCNAFAATISGTATLS